MLVRHQPTLTLELAMHALQAALDQARQKQLRISIAIVDASGQLIHQAHMDGAPQPSREIALGKARTACGFGIATRDWTARLQKASEAVRQGLPLQPGLVLFGGGRPFHYEQSVIGAIGISGASEDDDDSCAVAAREQVERLLQVSQACR